MSFIAKVFGGGKPKAPSGPSQDEINAQREADRQRQIETQRQIREEARVEAEKAKAAETARLQAEEADRKKEADMKARTEAAEMAKRRGHARNKTSGGGYRPLAQSDNKSSGVLLS